MESPPLPRCHRPRRRRAAHGQRAHPTPERDIGPVGGGWRDQEKAGGDVREALDIHLDMRAKSALDTGPCLRPLRIPFAEEVWPR